MAKALREAMDESVRSDPNNVWKYAGYKTFARKYNELAHAAINALKGRRDLQAFDVATMPGPGNMPAVGQKNIFESVRAELTVLTAYLENISGAREDEVDDLANFLQAKLRSAVFAAPADERQIQDCIEQLLIGRGLAKGLDYDRETGRLKVSSKEVVPDFIFPRLGLALEAKLVRPGRTSAVIDQLNADIAAYARSYSRLLFVLYDLSAIRDEAEFKHGLEVRDRIRVVIVKH
jgi:hypothetical protein